jgi:hypothetical protein
VALKKINQEECGFEIAVAENEILIVLWTVLAIEIDMEELSMPERLRDSVYKVKASHLFVANLWIKSYKFWSVK